MARKWTGDDQPLLTRPMDWPTERRIPAGRLDRDPGGFIPRDEQKMLLLGALAGVELGAWDKRIVEWLTGHDTSTVVSVVALIHRARALDRRRVAQSMAAQSTVLSPTDLTALLVAADVLGYHGREGLAESLRRIAQRTPAPQRRQPPEPRPPG